MTRRKAILSALLAPFALKSAAKAQSLKNVEPPKWEINPEWLKAKGELKFSPRDYCGTWQWIDAMDKGVYPKGMGDSK